MAAKTLLEEQLAFLWKAISTVLCYFVVINADIKLAKLYEECGQIYITEKVILQSLVNIEKFIDVSNLENYLFAHGVLTSIDELMEFTYPTCTHHARVIKLIGHATKAGRHGSFLLYASLYGSAKEGHQGHRDAVQLLCKKGISVILS